MLRKIAASSLQTGRFFSTSNSESNVFVNSVSSTVQGYLNSNYVV